MVMDVRGAVDSQGNVTAWDYQVWTPTHSSRPNASGGSLLAGSGGISAGNPTSPAPIATRITPTISKTTASWFTG